jgi:hypothetical protein
MRRNLNIRRMPPRAWLRRNDPAEHGFGRLRGYFQS